MERRKTAARCKRTIRCVRTLQYATNLEQPKKTKGHQQAKTSPLKNQDGEYTQNKIEITQRWNNWIKHQLQIPPEKEHPTCEHITEEQWGNVDKQNQEVRTQKNAEIHKNKQT